MTEDERKTGPSLDPETLASLRELQEPGEPDFLADLLKAYLEDLPARLTAIGKAMEAGDLKLIARSSHVLKGSSANLGAMRFSGLCREVESLSLRGESHSLQAAWVKLLEESLQVRLEMGRLLDGTPESRC